MNTGLYFSCQIGELPTQTFDVVDFTLEEALSTLFTLELKVSSLVSSINMDDQLLKNAELTIMVDGQVQRVIYGIVAEALRGDSGSKRTQYTFIIRPKMWLLTLTQDNRIFHFKSIPDILDELLTKHGVGHESKFIDMHKQWEYTTQRNETDYDFFCRLAAEEGITFWFEEQNVFYSDSRIGMKGGDGVIYNAHPQSSHKEHVVYQLQYGARMRPNAVHLKDYKFSHPDVGLDSKSKNAKKYPQYTMYDSYGRYDDDAVAKLYAKYRLEAYQAMSQSGQGKSNSILLMPGKMFSITEHPSDEINNRWQVVNIIHQGSLPQSVTDESASNQRNAVITNQFTFIPGRVDWRAPFIPKPVVHGTEPATVVGPAGEEIHVNEYGQVKIHFHWNKYDPPDEKASCWVRVSQNWNGDGFGFLATPRIGQEVIVAYVHGDIDQPIIIGTTYNGKNAPPLDLPAAKTQMSIKSKTHKGSGFNEMRFEDADGQQDFFMHAQKDMNTSVRNDRNTIVDMNHSENVGKNQAVNVKVNQSTTVGADQSIDVSGNRTDHVKLNETINIDQNQTITIGADQSETVTGNRTDHVVKSETVNIDVNQTTTIGGNHEVKISGTEDIFVAKAQKTHYDNIQSLTIKGDQDAKYLANRKITVSSNQEQSITGTLKLTVNGAVSETFSDSHALHVSAGQEIIVGAQQKLQSKTLVISAADSIVIGCGSSQITMDSAGNIQIMGVNISIAGQAEVTSTAPKVHSNGTSENIVEGAVVKLNP